MVVARRNQDSADLEAIASGCLAHGELARRVEALRERPGEPGGHVLDDDVGRSAVDGQLGYQAPQRARSAC